MTEYLQGGRKVPGHYTCIFNKNRVSWDFSATLYKVGVTNVTCCIAVYLTPVLLINLFHNSTIHLYPRRAYSNRILI